MSQKPHAPIKLRQPSNDAKAAPPLTTITLQKTISQPLTLGHIITLSIGIVMGAFIMLCAHAYMVSGSSTPANLLPTTPQPPVTSHADIVLPAAAFDVAARPVRHLPDVAEAETDMDTPSPRGATAEEAYTLLQSGHYDEAIDAYHQLLHRDPSREPEHGYLIEALGRSVSLQSEHELERLLQNTPNDARILNALGNFAMNENNYEEAALRYGRATEAEPDNAATWLALGIAADHADEVDRALNAYRHAAKLYKQNPPTDGNAALNKLQERIAYLSQEIGN